MYTTCTVDGLTPWRDRFNPCVVQLPLRLLWKGKLLKAYADVPLVAENHIYVHSSKPAKNSISEEALTDFSPARGRMEWERKFEEIYISNAYCLSGDTVFFSTKKELIAIKDGRTLWEIEGYFDCPLISGDSLVLSGMDGVYIVDPENGELQNKIVLNCPVGVSCSDGFLVVGTADNQLHGIQLETGKKLWQTDLTRQAQYTHPVSKEIIKGQVFRWAPIISDQKIVLQTDQLTCCFDLYTGEVLWERAFNRAPRFCGWACGNQRLYGFEGRSLYCIDLNTGAPIFVQQIFERSAWGAAPPFLTENVLFIASEGLHAYSTETGELLWEFWPKRKGMQNFSAMPVFVGGRLYASGKDGFLYCFEQA